MASSIGIYVGSTSCCVAVNKENRTSVVANDSGDRVTPSVVAYTDREKTVGLAAKQGKIRNAANTVTNVKHIIGKRFDDASIQDIIKQSSAKIIEKDGFCLFEVEFQERTIKVTPQEIMTLICKKVMDIAQVHVHGGNTVQDAVMAVPLHFTQQQCTLISLAAKDAGFNILQLISEPAAAALAYNIGQDVPSKSSNVIVYHLGGTVLDVTVLSVNGGMYRVLANIHDTTHGGEQLTDLLVEFCAADFQKRWKCDVRSNKRAVAKLHSACEVCKHVLSIMSTSTVSVESLYDGIDFNCSISRARLELLFTPTLQNCLQPMQKVLEDAGLKREKIDKVVITGGSTKIPKLKQLLKDFFPKVELLDSISPDEVVAMGTAIQADLLTSRDSIDLGENHQVELCSKAILLKVLDESNSEKLQTVIGKHTPIPVRRQHPLQVNTNQTSACVCVYEGETESCPQDATLLAKVVLRNLPNNSEEKVSITTVLHYKREGCLHVTCTEKTSGISEDVTIEVSA
ncbi:heat shock 70 kDa protein 14-like [Ptychodera flava]|uniref:heat shock 70 kDa protein 14-like n=1 Tax=Ptychodera flava TaxID=63121 RepID=UPI00396A2419